MPQPPGGLTQESVTVVPETLALSPVGTLGLLEVVDGADSFEGEVVVVVADVVVVVVTFGEVDPEPLKSAANAASEFGKAPSVITLSGLSL
jgi:carbamoylphosphate synthase large subunit